MVIEEAELDRGGDAGVDGEGDPAGVQHSSEPGVLPHYASQYRIQADGV
jgi:hypothetical protein